MRTVLTTEPLVLDHVMHLVGDELELDDAEAVRLIERGDAMDPADLPAIDWWKQPRRILAEERSERDLKPFTDVETPGALRIVQGVSFDPGCAAYRFHSAINETSIHASMFFRWHDTSPYTSLRQFDGEKNEALLRAAIRTADVVHCHVNYIAITNSRVKPTGRVVRHYHGSMPDGSSHVEQGLDAAMGAIQVGARLSLLAESPRMQWLPIAVPVERYGMMRARAAVHPHRNFRIAHSPTNRGYKGTDAFLSAIATLKARGVSVEAVLIENVRHGVALAAKATCDAVFDSFWLGLQGSGLEAGAMGLPAIAGDETVAALYREHVGHVPYTFANTELALIDVIGQLATEPAYYAQEAMRLHRYVTAYHDYASVAARYERILDAAL